MKRARPRASSTREPSDWLLAASGVVLYVLAPTLLLSEHRDAPTPVPGWVLWVAPPLLYGVLDELHQSRVPGRDASALDVLTDLVSGAAVLWIVFTLARRELPERALLARLGLGVCLCAASAALAMLS